VQVGARRVDALSFGNVLLPLWFSSERSLPVQLSHKSRTTKLLEFYRLLHPFRITNAYGVFPKNTVAPFR
jgi:hypothetical protein